MVAAEDMTVADRPQRQTAKAGGSKLRTSERMMGRIQVGGPNLTDGGVAVVG